MKITNEPVPVDCLDKPRSFLMDMGAAIRIEQSTGVNVLLDIRAFAGALAVPSTVVKITRELLIHDDPRVTSEAIVKMIDVAGVAALPILMKAALRSWFHFQGKSDEDYQKFEAAMEARRDEADAAVPLASKPLVQ